MKDNLIGSKLEMRYVNIDEVVLWARNPKLHDIGAISESIKRYGFRDPSAYDATLGGLVEGNGRAETLKTMRRMGDNPPKGILTDDDGNWYMPILFGLDAESQIAAEQYAVDHNNLTLSGGDFTISDFSGFWDKDKYLDLLNSFVIENVDTAALDKSDIGVLINILNKSDEEQEEQAHEGNDEKQLIIQCGSARGFADMMEHIQVLIDEHPEWLAKIIEK